MTKRYTKIKACPQCIQHNCCRRGFTPTPFIKKGVSLQSKRGFTPTPILALLRNFLDIFCKKFNFYFNQKLIKENKQCNKKTMPKLVSGFMMVEVIVVISIIVVSVLAAMSVTEKSIYVSRQALHVKEASFLLEEGAESVRIIRDNAWSNISSLNVGTDYYPTFSAGTWSLSTTPSTVGIFTRKINVSNVNRDSLTDDIASSGADDVGTKLITVSLSWNDGGDTLSKTLSFYIMDIFSQ